MVRGRQYELTLIEDTFDAKGILVENKLGVIGNSEEQFEGQAFDVRFSPNVNGTKKLTFCIPVYYNKPETGELVLNPRYRHITNERKVRLKYNDKYHELVIKKIEEERDDNLSKIMKVTCTDAVIEELSKQGWSLYFNEEGGIGTVQEIMPKILADTDWTFDAENSDIFYESEYINEDGILNTVPGASQKAPKKTYDPVHGHIYWYWGSRNLLGLPVSGSDQIEVFKYTHQEFIQSEIGRNFLTNGTSFYTLEHWIAAKNNLVIATNEKDTYPRYLQLTGTDEVYNRSLDARNFQFAIDNTYTFAITVRAPQATQLTIEIGDTMGTTLNQVVRQVINVPASNQWTTYGFQFAPRIAGKFNRVFIKKNTSGTLDIGKVRLEIGGRNAILNSDFHDGTKNWNFYDNSTTENNVVTRLQDYEFRQYVLKTNRIFQTAQSTAYFRSLNNSDLATLSFDLKGDVHGTLRCIFQGWRGGTLDQQEMVFNYTNFWDSVQKSIRLVSATGYDSISLQFIPSSTIFISNIKFEQGGRTAWSPALEDEIVQYTYSPVAEFIGRDYYYYFEKNIKTMLTLTAIQASTLIQRFEVPEKIRILLGEKSNAYNLIQTVCELFEGWAQFNIEYDAYGTIKKDKNGNRIKKVTIKETMGKDLPYGIEYGVNLKNITRTIESSEIVTKMYVENNDYQYAQDGVVSIAQAEENPSKETYIINMDYYIELGLLPYTTQGDIVAYNTDMRALNEILERDTAMRNRLQTEMNLSIIPQLETLSFKEIALEEALRAIEDQLKQLLPTADVEALKAQQANYKQLLADSKITTDELRKKREIYEGQITDLDGQITQRIQRKRAIQKEFNHKYAAYIKEGVWQDSNYIFPELFYRDAVEVSKRSAQPQVAYDVGIVDISYLDEYGYLILDVGDRTFVRDEELFLKKIDDEYFPQDIPVFISEIEFVLDDPDKTSVKVQNFKSRFDDVFQRIVASTETLKLNEKVYDRAANFTTDQQINVDILQNSLLNNNLILAQSRDNTVRFDNTGITVADANNTNRMVKIVSGGIFITKDGINWKAGITPDGINIDELTAGLINTKNIQIWNSQEPRFLWDANGLIAYGIDANNRTDFESRITFNHEGLVFCRNINQSKPELALTWDGLAINVQDGAVKIGSGAGIVVEDSQTMPVKRVEIGKINRIAGESDTFNKDFPVSTPIYGMILRNSDNMETLITSDTGELWLKRAITVGDKGGQDMAGVSGITQYSQREMENYIRNEQYYLLQQATLDNNPAEIQRLKDLISKPIDNKFFTQFKADLEKDPIRFWSGSNAPTQASFRVYQSGLMWAKNAFVEGDITAWTGHFRGRVYVGEQLEGEFNTGSGISGLITDRVRFWAGSPFIYGSTLESQPEDGLFKVYDSGKVFATDMDVHGLFTAGKMEQGTFEQGMVYKPTIFIAGTDYWYSGILEQHAIPKSLLARLWVGGLTPNSANLVITEDGGFYGADVHVSGLIEGEGLRVAQIKIDDTGIYTIGFSTGIIGRGWMISNDGTANFNNVHVRGELSTVVFKKNEVQIAGGNLLIRPTSALADDIDFDGIPINTIVTFDVMDENYFRVGEYLLIKEEFTQMQLRITAVNGTTITAVLRTAGRAFVKGAPVISWGTTGHGGILLSASQNSIDTIGTAGLNMTNGAVMDMHETIIVNDNITESLRLRVGDLTNIPFDGVTLSGYGLFADNVALRGNIFLSNAGIYTGNEKVGGENKAIRFWAGTNFNYRFDANFKVYEDGTVLARGGIFEGKIIATEGGFSGSIGTAGITINDNTGSFYIEKRSGNNAYFNTIAVFSSEGITVYDGGIRIYKSMADQWDIYGNPIPKPTTFQYIYPYVFAVNDTTPTGQSTQNVNERFVMRKAHFWTFDAETATNAVNYSIRTNKGLMEFTTATLANQDKADYIYSLTNFTGQGTRNRFSFIQNTSLVTLERTSSYVGVTQKDSTLQDIIRVSLDQYKAITSGNDRKYELAISVSMEYPDNMEAYLTISYIPKRGNVTPEIIKFPLPLLKNTPTRLFKEVICYGYSAANPFTFTIGVENTTRFDTPTNNRLIIHSVELKEITSTVLSAEQLAFSNPLLGRIGLNTSTQFVIHNRETVDLLINSVNASGAVQNAQKVGINKSATAGYALDVSGTIRATSGVAGVTTNSLALITSGGVGIGVTSAYSGATLSVAGNIMGSGQVRSNMGSTDYCLLNGRFLEIRGESSASAIPELYIYSTGSRGDWGISSCINFYNNTAGQEGLRLRFLATYMVDGTGTGTRQGGLIVRNDWHGLASSLGATGELYQYTNIRVPITRSAAATPQNSYYPSSTPKLGDIWVRYV